MTWPWTVRPRQAPRSACGPTVVEGSPRRASELVSRPAHQTTCGVRWATGCAMPACPLTSSARCSVMSTRAWPRWSTPEAHGRALRRCWRPRCPYGKTYGMVWFCRWMAKVVRQKRTEHGHLAEIDTTPLALGTIVAKIVSTKWRRGGETPGARTQLQGVES